MFHLSYFWDLQQCMAMLADFVVDRILTDLNLGQWTVKTVNFENSYNRKLNFEVPVFYSLHKLKL